MRTYFTGYVVHSHMLAHLSQEFFDRELLPDHVLFIQNGRSQFNIILTRIELFAIIRASAQWQILVFFCWWLIVLIHCRCFEQELLQKLFSSCYLRLFDFSNSR